MSARPPPRSLPPPRGPSDSAPTILREGPSQNPPPRSSRSAGLTTTAPSITNAQRVARNAIYALGGFTALTVLVLLAFFAREESPWGFPSVVALAAAIGAAATAALLWRFPSRQHAYAALGVMGFSLLRVGLPSQWTWASVALITVTALLAIPVVQAAMALPRS